VVRPTDRGGAPIRDAVHADTAAIARIFRASALSVDADRDALLSSPASLSWHWPEEPARVRVVTGPSGLVGFATTLLPGVGRVPAEIDHLFVVPARQRAGLGTSLVEDAAVLAAAAGHDEISVIASEAAPFYRRLGFSGDEPVRTMHAPAWRLVRRLSV
jgi:GNAT superfamily N-acetyltransferase